MVHDTHTRRRRRRRDICIDYVRLQCESDVEYFTQVDLQHIRPLVIGDNKRIIRPNGRWSIDYYYNMKIVHTGTTTKKKKKTKRYQRACKVQSFWCPDRPMDEQTDFCLPPPTPLNQCYREQLIGSTGKFKDKLINQLPTKTKCRTRHVCTEQA